MGPPGALIEYGPEILRGLDIGWRLLGLGVTGAPEAIPVAGPAMALGRRVLDARDPGREPLPFELPRSEKIPGAAKAFWGGLAEEGDIGTRLERALEAAQDELEAGWGYWLASEAITGAVAPFGLARGGAVLGRAATPLAQTLTRPVARVAPRAAPSIARGIEAAARGLGRGAQVPWQAEEAVGRVIAAPFRGAVRRFRGRGPGGVVEEALEEVPGGAITPEDVAVTDAILGTPTTARPGAAAVRDVAEEAPGIPERYTREWRFGEPPGRGLAMGVTGVPLRGAREQAEYLLTTRQGLKAAISQRKKMIIDEGKARRRSAGLGAKQKRLAEYGKAIEVHKQEVRQLQDRLDAMPTPPVEPVLPSQALVRLDPIKQAQVDLTKNIRAVEPTVIEEEFRRILPDVLEQTKTTPDEYWDLRRASPGTDYLDANRLAREAADSRLADMRLAGQNEINERAFRLWKEGKLVSLEGWEMPKFATVPDEQAGPFIAKAGGSPPPPPLDPPTAGGISPKADDIFAEIDRFATPDELKKIAKSPTKRILTVMRRHEAGITADLSEAWLRVKEGIPDSVTGQKGLGEDSLIDLGLAVNIEGRAVIKKSAIPEIDALNLALHEGGPVPPRLQGQYDELKRFTNWEEMDRLNFDPDMPVIDEYFYRGWKMSEELTAAVAQRPKGAVGWPANFTKPRNKATYSEMRAAGYEPLVWNPYEQWRISVQQGIRHRQQMMLVMILKRSKLALPTVGRGQRGKVTVMPDEIKDWRTPKIGPAFEGRSYDPGGGIIGDFKSGAWVTHKDTARRLEAMYPEPFVLTQTVLGKEIDIIKAIDAATFIPKRVKLFISFFQHIDFLQRSFHGAWMGMIDQIDAGFRAPGAAGKIKGILAAARPLAVWPKSAYKLFKAEVSPAYRQALRKELLSTEPLVPGRPGLHNKAIMEAGLSTVDPTIVPVNMAGFASEAAEEIGMLGVPAVIRLIKQIESATRRGLFDGWYPSAMLTDIKNNWAPAAARKFPDLNDEQLAGVIAKEINKKYSTIPVSQSIFQGRFMRFFLQRVFFSVGESEGLLRQGASLITGPYKALWAKHWLGAYMSLIAQANIIHYLSTRGTDDKAWWEGEHLPLDRFMPLSTENWGPFPFGYRREFAAPTIPIKGRSGTEVILDLVGQMDTVFRVLDPISFLSSRESVPVRAAWNQITGKDFFGAPITRVGPTVLGIEGIYSRIASALVDIGAPIGAGQAVVDIARERIPLVGELLPPGEERLGFWPQLLQATGIGLRAETTPDLLRRMARESGEVVQLSTHPRFGQPIREWDEMTKPQQRSAIEKFGDVGEDMEEELAWRTETGALRGTEGAVLRQKRTELEDETAGVMEKVAEQYLRMPRETGEFVAEDARNAIGKALSKHYFELDVIYVDVGEDEEPEENTLRHHMWRYRQIFAEFGEDGPGTDEEWEDFNKAVAKFWRNTPEEDVGLVLGEMRQLELKFPEEIRRVLEAKRYASAFKMDINGIRYSYWDLDTLPEVEKDILDKSWTNLGSYDVTIADVRDYIQRSSAARSAGKINPRSQAIDKAFRDSNSDGGVLFEIKKDFEKQAPEEWLGAMFDAGYYFKSKGWLWKNIGKYLREGYEWGQYPYKDLYEEALIANR